MDLPHEVIDAQRTNYMFANSERLEGDNFVVIHERWVRTWSVEYVEKPLSKIPYM